MESDLMGYIIMRKDEPITYAEFTMDGTMVGYAKDNINKELAPLQDAYQNNWLKLWWKERSIPIDQDNIRSFLNKNGYSIPDEYLIKNLGLSLTDYYWLKPIDSDLCWKDVNLYDNDFKSNILSNTDERYKDDGHTPTYSPNGSLQGTIEKTWCIIDDNRYLIKGNHSDLSSESINEVIAGKIHESQGFSNYVDYELIHINGKDYAYGCKSMLFTSQKEELVSAWALFTNEKKSNNISSYDHLLHMCSKFGMNAEEIRQNLEYQILTDFIISGHDRHLNNIAFIRDAETLEFKGLAPIFDSGGALFAGKAIPKNEKELLNITTHSFEKKEKNLLDLVRDKTVVDLAKLPSASYIKKMYGKDPKMHEKDINNIAHWYEKKVDLCREFQLGKNIFSKQYINSQPNRN